MSQAHLSGAGSVTGPVQGGRLRRGSAVAVVLFSALLAWGCSSAPQRVALPETAGVPGAPGPNVAIQEPRSQRGNPPFYEVFGRRYYVLDTSEGYRERGIASWYGSDFHGLQTSNGEIYDMYAYTAASPNLPIPTWVEVTHLGNGKRVIVRINDRGPFVGDRIIDLSYRAAQALDMVNEGTARVEVRALGAPASTPEPPQPVQANRRGMSVISEAQAAVPANEHQPRQLFLQVGAFSERGNAQRFVDRLHASGFQNSFIVSNSERGTTMHRVRVGPVAGSDEYDRMAARLQSLGINDAHPVVDH
jgi:rare lipoprotein A